MHYPPASIHAPQLVVNHAVPSEDGLTPEPSDDEDAEGEEEDDVPTYGNGVVGALPQRYLELI